MAKMTFLELVNAVVEESKVTLDPLTAANFAAPPRTSLYGRIKKWINDAYVELLEDKPDWQFRVERATVPVYPRLYVVTAPGYTPAVNDTIVASSSGVSFTVAAVHASTEEADDNLGAETTISVVFAEGFEPSTLIMRESLNKTNGVPVTGAMTLLGLGRYSFDDLVTGLESIDMDTVRAHYLPNDAVIYGNNEMYPVLPLAWSRWDADYDLHPFSDTTFPRYISETPQGTYSLYPYPDRQIYLTFEYRRAVTRMVNHNDSPTGLPSRYHEYLLWKATEELADFDKNATLFSRARKHTTKYEHYMFRDEMPSIGIAGWNGVRKDG